MLRNGAAALLRRCAAAAAAGTTPPSSSLYGCLGAAAAQEGGALLLLQQEQQAGWAVLVGMRALHTAHWQQQQQQRQPPTLRQQQRRRATQLWPDSATAALPRPQQQRRQLTGDAAPAEAAAAAEAGGGGGGGLVIDPSAIKRLKELQAERGPAAPRLALRVEVEGGGCSGFQYRFRIDEDLHADGPNADDVVFERDGAAVVVDATSLGFLRGAVVEYEDSLMRSAFQIASNPNSESTCGCGTSFSAKF